MSTRSAILDLGTNTFHLLIAERQDGRPNVLFRDKSAVKLGMGRINEDRITADAEERAMQALRAFTKKIREYHVDSIRALGTSAFRNSRNGGELLARIKDELGLDIEVINGEQEARYIYRGTLAAVSSGDDIALVMDIGGGSVEFIVGRRSEILWLGSFEIGGQRLLERFHKHDPILSGEITELNIYLEGALAPLWTALEQYRPALLIGASGTFDTLSEMHCLRNGIVLSPEATETPLTPESFYEIFNDLVVRNRTERMALPGMIEMRVDMIVVTSTLIKSILDRYPIKTIRVSTYSLKEGALYLPSHG